MAAIPAVWPAVAICPVVQKEIAKISAVPMSRHVMAFAIALRIGMLSPVCHWPESSRPSRVVCCAEFRRGPWSYAKLAGPLSKRVHTPLNC
jgi:hypothetical protein